MFKYRLASIRDGVHYYAGHEPCTRMDGRIAYWLNGSMCLQPDSFPQHAFPVFKSGGSNGNIRFESEFKDPVHGFYWPVDVPDEAYAIYAQTD